MTVASLIKCLQEMDADAQVYMTDYADKDALFARVTAVEYDGDGDVLIVAGAE